MFQLVSKLFARKVAVVSRGVVEGSSHIICDDLSKLLCRINKNVWTRLPSGVYSNTPPETKI